MKLKNYQLLIIVAVLIGLALIASGAWTPGAEGGDQMSAVVTIGYADGTTDTYGPNTNARIPLKVWFEGKEISYIQVQLQAKLSWEGELVQYSQSSWAFVYCDWVEKKSDVDSTSPSPLPASDSWVSMVSITVWASEIQDWDGGAFANHTLDFHFTSGVALTFSDGSTAARAGEIDAATLTVTVTSMGATLSDLNLQTSYFGL